MRARLGQPAMVSGYGDRRSWQYRSGGIQHDDFSEALVFRKSDGRLVSVSHIYQPEQNVDAMFPAAETTMHWPASIVRPQASQADREIRLLFRRC